MQHRSKPYPVHTSNGPAGSACPIGWEIVIIKSGDNLTAYYVRETAQ